jgi:hypothetical protein
VSGLRFNAWRLSLATAQAHVDIDDGDDARNRCIALANKPIKQRVHSIFANLWKRLRFLRAQVCQRTGSDVYFWRRN